VKLSFVVKSLIENNKLCFVLEREMQSDLFILESWTKVTPWVKDIQLIEMEITKANQAEFGA
jgi:hypothetical protein